MKALLPPVGVSVSILDTSYFVRSLIVVCCFGDPVKTCDKRHPGRRQRKRDVRDR